VESLSKSRVVIGKVWTMQMKHLRKSNHQLRTRESYLHARVSITTSQQDSEESIGVNFHRSELPSERTPSTDVVIAEKFCVECDRWEKLATMHVLKQSTLQCNVTFNKCAHSKSRNEDVCVGSLPWKVS
jgi:hypothetical protein